MICMYMYIYGIYICIILIPLIIPFLLRHTSPHPTGHSSKPLDRRHTGKPGTVGAAMTKGILGAGGSPGRKPRENP